MALSENVGKCDDKDDCLIWTYRSESCSVIAAVKPTVFL